MPTPLNNQASIRYNYNNNTGTANSNTVTTNLLDQYTLTATKTPLSATFRPGENITYIVRVENNGSGELHNVTVTDDLGGGGANAPLVYQPSSLRSYVNNTPVTLAPTAQAGTLAATLPAPLASGDVALVIYTARVRPDAPFGLASVTNTASVTANGGSAAGAAVTVTPSPTATIVRASYADVALYKEADKQSVVAGEPLTYTFTLTNTGNQEADTVTLTDRLPTGFSVTQVTVNNGNGTNVLATGDYTVAADNTITVPSTTGTPITVAAATAAAPGVTTVTVTGTMSTTTTPVAPPQP